MKLVAIMMFGAINTYSYGNYRYDTPKPTQPKYTPDPTAQKYTPYPTAQKYTPKPTAQKYTPYPTTSNKYTPKPSQPKYTPDPTAQKYTPYPTAQKYTPKPTQPKYTPYPTAQKYTPYPTTSNKYTPKPTQPKYTPDPTKQLLIPPNMCPPEEDQEINPCTAENIKLYGFYYPSCISCCNFIQCDESLRPHIRPCAPGTSWDQIAHTCVHNTGQCKDKLCNNNIYRPKYTPAPVLVYNYKPQTTETNSYIPPKIDTDKCYNLNKKYELYDNPCNAEQRASGIYYFKSCDSCCNYIQCDAFGEAHPRSCGVGTSWDQLALTCNHNYGQCNKECGNNYVPPVDDKCYDLKKENPCTEENIEQKRFFFKSCSSCCDFIQCDAFGEAFPMSCGKGTYWDQSVHSCNHNYGQCDKECGNDNNGNLPVYKKY